MGVSIWMQLKKKQHNGKMASAVYEKKSIRVVLV